MTLSSADEAPSDISFFKRSLSVFDGPLMDFPFAFRIALMSLTFNPPFESVPPAAADLIMFIGNPTLSKILEFDEHILESDFSGITSLALRVAGGVGVAGDLDIL